MVTTGPDVLKSYGVTDGGSETVESVTEGGYVFGSGGSFAPDLMGFEGAARVRHGLGGGGEASPAEVRG
jgi:hypothetical protein